MKEIRKGFFSSPKVPLTIIGVFGFVVLVFGFLNISHNIAGPFENTGWDSIDLNELDQSDDLNKVLDKTSIQRLEQQGKDTDEDGLSDFDEINLYLTSPYLADSDSDGYTDGEEVASGHDPSCPRGSNCRIPGLNGDQGSYEEVGLFDDLANYLGQSEVDIAEVTNFTNLSIQGVRDLLVKSGEVSQGDIDQIEDDVLMDAYHNVLVDLANQENNN